VSKLLGEGIEINKYSTRLAQNVFSQRKRVASIKADFEDTDSEGSVPVAPGPGSYYISSNAGMIKSEPSPFQYFGSTSPRFEKIDASRFPGPGSYKEKVEIPKNSPT
jgi:hypothetical protein